MTSERGMRNAECGRDEPEDAKAGRGPFLLLICGLLLTFSDSFAADPASVSPQGSAARSQDEIVRSVEDHYRAVDDITARVVQTNDLRSLGRTQTFEGTLSIRKPGRLRLDYTNGQIIVLDGTTAWIYSKKSGQAIKRAFADIEQANIPVALLLGAADIRRDFEVVSASDGPERTIELIPKKPGEAMKKLVLRTDASGRITAMTIVGGSGNSTEIVFSDVRENGGVDEKRFRFRAPKGTEIIEQ